jgi:transposase InsO family protein
MHAKSGVDMMHWHQRLGHLNTSAIVQLARGSAVGIEIELGDAHEADCIACIEGKQHRLLFKTGRTRATKVGELLHMDLAGPMEITSFDNKHYFLIVIDDYSRAVWTSAIASKTEVVTKVREYIAQLENAFALKVKAVMADNGTEFINSEMNTFLRAKGIGLFTSVPYTPQQNGIAE